MTHTVIYNPDLRIITTTFVGDINLKYAKEITTEYAIMAKEKNCTLLLHDLRQATIKFSILELYEAPKIISAIFTSVDIDPHLIKRALIVENISSHIQFFENVMVNRGQRDKLFQDIDEAKKWLLQK